MARFNSELRFNDNLNSFFNSAPRRVSLLDKGFAGEVVAMDGTIPANEMTTTVEMSNIYATIPVVEAKIKSLLMPGVMVYENNGLDIFDVLASIPKTDLGIGEDAWGIGVVTIFVSEDTLAVEFPDTYAMAHVISTGSATDAPDITADIPVSEKHKADDTSNTKALTATQDSGDTIELTQVAKLYFYITEDGILNPLGVPILRDSKNEILPGVRSISEQIPGRHGEITFDSQIEPRLFDLHVAKECSQKDRGEIRQTIARALQPATDGTKLLAFAEDPEKMYKVKYIGKINPTYYTDGVGFTVPLKANDPFVYGSFENIHIGSGVLYNNGDYEASLVIEVSGPVTSPVVTVGSETLKYVGTLASTDTLVINTEDATVEVNGANALHKYQGGFPMLQPGETRVAAPAGTVFRWRDRWI